MDIGPGCADSWIGQRLESGKKTAISSSEIISSSWRWVFRQRRLRGFMDYCGRDEGKKNRASQSGGDRRARGIFELSTTVGLRRTSVLVCTRNQSRNQFRLTKNKCI